MYRRIMALCIIVGFLIASTGSSGISQAFFFNKSGNPQAIIVVGSKATSDEIVASAAIAAQLGSLAQKREEEEIEHPFSVIHRNVLPEEVIFDVPDNDYYAIDRHFSLQTLWYYDDPDGIYGNNNGRFEPWETHEELQFRFYDPFTFHRFSGMELKVHRIFFAGRDLPMDEELSNRYIPSLIYRIDNIRVPPSITIDGFRLEEPRIRERFVGGIWVSEEEGLVVDMHRQMERGITIPSPHFVSRGFLPKIHFFGRDYTVVAPYMTGTPSFFLEQYIYKGEAYEYGGFEVRVEDVDVDHDKVHLKITNPIGRIYDFWMILDPLHGFSPSPQLSSQTGENVERNGNSLRDVFFLYPYFVMDGIATFVGADKTIGAMVNIYTLENMVRLSNRTCCHPYERMPYLYATYVYNQPTTISYKEEYPTINDVDATETYTSNDILIFGGIPYVGAPPHLTSLRHFGADEVFWDRFPNGTFDIQDVIVEDNDATFTITGGDTVLFWGGTSAPLSDFPATILFHDADTNAVYNPGEPIIQDNDSSHTFTAGDIVIVGVAPPPGSSLAHFSSEEMFWDRNGNTAFDGGDWVVNDGGDRMMSGGDSILYGGVPPIALVVFPPNVMYWSCDPVDLNQEDEWVPHQRNSIGTWYDDVDDDGTKDRLYEMNFYLCDSFGVDDCCTEYSLAGPSGYFLLNFSDVTWDDNGNGIVWESGPDLQPGRAGINDDADGIVDNGSELGYWGSDDVYDSFDDGIDFSTRQYEVVRVTTKKSVTLNPSSIIKIDGELTKNERRKFNLILVGTTSSNSWITQLVRKKAVPDDGSPYDWMRKGGGYKFYTNPFKLNKDIIVVSGPRASDVRHAAYDFLKRLVQPLPEEAIPSLILTSDVSPREVHADENVVVTSHITDLEGHGMEGIKVTVEIVFPTNQSFTTCEGTTDASGVFSCTYRVAGESNPGTYYAAVTVQMGIYAYTVNIPFTVVP